MKKFILALLAIIAFGSATVVQAASHSDIVSYQGFLTAVHGNQYAHTVRVKNTGADPGPIYLEMSIDSTFQSDDPIVYYNTTGTDIICSTPPTYTCETDGNSVVNGEFRVIWSGIWYNAGSFYASAESSDAFNGTQHDYILKGPIVVS